MECSTGTVMCALISTYTSLTVRQQAGCKQVIKQWALQSWHVNSTLAMLSSIQMVVPLRPSPACNPQKPHLKRPLAARLSGSSASASATAPPASKVARISRKSSASGSCSSNSGLPAVSSQPGRDVGCGAACASMARLAFDCMRRFEGSMPLMYHSGTSTAPLRGPWVVALCATASN